MDKIFDAPDESSVVALEPPDPASLSAWAALYFQLNVLGSPIKTQQAKQRVLSLFLSFFATEVGHDQVDGWTPAVTKAFLSSLRSRTSAATGKKLAVTTINRVLASVRHFGRWLHQRRPLLAGSPFEGVKDLVPDRPAWNGLSSRQVLRLKSACEQRLKACTRRDQDPLLEGAVFHVLLNTGLREFELCGLDLAQFHHRGFHGVTRKGQRVSDKVPVPGEARDWLDRYLDESRGREPGPLFLSRRGSRIQEQDVRRICHRISAQACAQLPKDERFRLNPHQLRHTFLKRIADKHGVHVAQRMSGNVSIREVFRYTQPSQDEMDGLAESVFAA